jgi:hypothetical protein
VAGTTDDHDPVRIFVEYVVMSCAKGAAAIEVEYMVSTYFNEGWHQNAFN